MCLQRHLSRVFFASVLLGPSALAQVSPATSGEITVKLTQGLDSAADPAGISQGRVTKSTNPALPVGTTVSMGVVADSGSGGYVVKLTELGIDGKTLPANSSDVVAAPDFFNKALERTRAPGQPQDAVSGSRVFLPRNMIVRFTLAEPAPGGPSPATASNGSRPGPTVMTPTSPSVGPVGGQTFNPQTAPNIKIPAVDALAARVTGSSSTVVQAGMEVGFSTFNARENVIVGGAIQPAPPGFFHGMRGARLNPGTVVKIMDVRAMDDGEHDILHVLLEDESFPTFTNIALVFPKGDLSTLSEPALEKTVTPFFTLPAQRGTERTAASMGSGQIAGADPQYLYVLEGIGLRMSLDQVRAAAKTAGSLKGPVKQGPTTYNLRTKDLSFDVEFDQNGRVYQYNVSAINPRKLPETENSGPLYDHLTQAFGPANSWGKPVIYELGEGLGAYAIISDPVHFQLQ